MINLFTHVYMAESFYAIEIYRVRQQKPDAQFFNSKETF